MPSKGSGLPCNLPDNEIYAPFGEKTTGIANTIFIATKSTSIHHNPLVPNIKIAINPPKSLNVFDETVTIFFSGRVSDKTKIDNDLLIKARGFINLNRKVLMDYWNYKISTDELLDRLRKISPDILEEDTIKALRIKLYEHISKKKNGCWEYDSAKISAGYGEFWYNNKHYLTHRVSWIVNKGPIPEGMNVLHKCDNPPCVRPSHLFIGDDQANMDDMIAKGRARHDKAQLDLARSMRGPYKRGEDHHNAKLTWSIVRKIRHRYANGDHDKVAIAKAFNVSRHTIHAIVNNHHWKE